MEKDGLPRYSDVVDEHAFHYRRRRYRRRFLRLAIFAFAIYTVYAYTTNNGQKDNRHYQDNIALSIDKLQADYAVCSKLRSTPQDPSGPRERNARYVDGHKPILIRNATIWTGEPEAGTLPEDARLGKGYSWKRGDVLMEFGLIKRVEHDIAEQDLPDDCIVLDVEGRQVTSGIVDM